MSNQSLLSILLFLFLKVAHAQPSIEWQKAYGGSDYDAPASIQVIRGGGYIVAGTTGSNDGDVSSNHGYHDFWILRLDSLGGMLWEKEYGGSDLDDAFSIQQTNDGGFVVAGFTKSNDGDVSGNHGDFDAWILKIDSLGAIQWQKCLGGSGWEEAWDIKQTADGGYIVAGRCGSIDGDVTVNQGSLDYWVIKLNNVGTIEWQKSLGGSFLDIAYSVQPTIDGGYIVAGESNSLDGDVMGVHGSSDYWVVKLNFEGKIEWQKALGGTGLDRANEIQHTIDGGFIVTGQARSNDGDIIGAHGAYDYWVVKLNASGGIEWQKALGGSNEDFGQTIKQTLDSGYILLGFTSSTNGDVIGNDGGKDFWLIKLTETGELQWQKTLGGTNQERGLAVQQTPDLGYILAGEAWSNNGDVSGVHGKNDFWVVKLSPESSSTSSPAVHPLAIHPNPAQSSIHLTFPLEETALSVSISDLLGREVKGPWLYNTGVFLGTIDVSALPQGLYLLKARAHSGSVFAGKFWKGVP